MTNDEFPTLRRGDAVVLTGALVRMASPRTTDQFRLVVEVTSVNGQPVVTPGRCSELEFVRPSAALTALEVGDALEVRGTISAAGPLEKGVALLEGRRGVLAHGVSR